MTMSKPVRKRMSANARRDQLLDATRELAVAEGFHAVSLERIAQTCGVTRTLIYQQFGSLSGLLLAMVDREIQCAARGLNDALRVQPTQRKVRFVATLAEIFRAVEAAPSTWRMFMMPSDGGPPELYQRLAQAVAYTRKFLDDSLLALDAEVSSLAAADRELTVHLMYAMGEELIRLYLQDPQHYPVERLLKQAERLSGTLFQGGAGV